MPFRQEVSKYCPTRASTHKSCVCPLSSICHSQQDYNCSEVRIIFYYLIKTQQNGILISNLAPRYYCNVNNYSAKSKPTFLPFFFQCWASITHCVSEEAERNKIQFSGQEEIPNIKQYNSLEEKWKCSVLIFFW